MTSWSSKKVTKVTKQLIDTCLFNSNNQIAITNGYITYDDRRETFDELKCLRAKNIRNPIIAYLNINSVRNKFADFSELIANYVDIIILAETKLDITFPRNQFSLPDFKAPIRVDCNANSGGLLALISQQITSKEMKNIPISSDIQAVAIELNVKNTKWLLLPIYRPPCQKETYFLEEIQRASDICSQMLHNMLRNNHDLAIAATLC